jgi:hypothetical protein
MEVTCRRPPWLSESYHSRFLHLGEDFHGLIDHPKAPLATGR